jgi:hypothetical protein
MPRTLDDVLRANPMIVTRPMAEGAVLMNATSGDCFELNAVGARVWDEIGRGVKLRELVQNLARDYGEDPATVGADVLRVIDDLARQGIVLPAP